MDILSLVVFLVGAVGFEAEADRLVNACKFLRTDEQATQGIARYEFPGKKRTRFMYALHTLDLPRMIYLRKCSARFPPAAFTQLCNRFIRHKSFISVFDLVYRSFSIACFLCKEGVVTDGEIELFPELFHACVTGDRTAFLMAATTDQSWFDRTRIDTYGRSVLYRACEERSMYYIEFLGDIRDMVNIPDNHGWTPLHVACWEGYADIAKLLCDKGADINVHTVHTNTPYRYACHKNRTEIVEMLSKRGANLSLGKKIVTP
jgi:hypothetical protein